jgi:hypothetical protein
MSAFIDLKFAINHASSNVLLDFGAIFSLPAIKQSGFCLFVNQNILNHICIYNIEEKSKAAYSNCL